MQRCLAVFALILATQGAPADIAAPQARGR